MAVLIARITGSRNTGLSCHRVASCRMAICRMAICRGPTVRHPSPVAVVKPLVLGDRPAVGSGPIDGWQVLKLAES